MPLLLEENDVSQMLVKHFLKLLQQSDAIGCDTSELACHLRRGLPVLLLEVSLAEQHEANLEAEHADLAGALAIVHVQQPVN